MNRKITISGVGCCLIDHLYNNVSFSSPAFLKYLSKTRGDGGLTPGQLVFQEEFELFSGSDLKSSLEDITSGRPADKINIGGPAIVALIHAAQMLDDSGCMVRFYGCHGEDSAGYFLKTLLSASSINMDNYFSMEGPTPSTFVLSDPDYNLGSGERIFINSIGAAGNYTAAYLDDDFFASDVVVFGGTALVPCIHDDLNALLSRAKRQGCITIVNTVYDFRNEKRRPDRKWPLGASDDSYRNIDLLIANLEEALRLSGKSSLKEAMEVFHHLGTGAAIITNGAGNIHLFAGKGSIFKPADLTEMPVSAAIIAALSKGLMGDTTGCGDNFVGGVIASLATQLQHGEIYLDLQEASVWGIVAGGFSCFYMGGAYQQKTPGEKRERLKPFYQEYQKQIHDA